MLKNGNSQAIRIPAELAFERQDIELEIERMGDDFIVDGRGDQGQNESESF